MKRRIRPSWDVNIGIFFAALILFMIAALWFEHTLLALCEGGIIIALFIYFLISRRIRSKKLEAYIESVAYDSESAQNKTIVSFPLPIAVFRLEDSHIVWGNELFFSLMGSGVARMNAKVVDIFPDFSGKWLLEGKKQYPSIVTVGERKYQVHGNIIRPEGDAESEDAFMGVTYWVDVTEYDDIRLEYEATRPVLGVVVIDNYEELIRNQPDRVKNDLRDSIEEKLTAWTAQYNAVIRRYDRDRYIAFFTSRNLDDMKTAGFPILKELHSVMSPAGIEATISIGLGDGAENLSEALSYADMAAELALTRGGDQAVVKNRLSFDFFGGRGLEVEKRTKVKSRVMANTLGELIKDSSRVLVMGHKYSDFDAVGAAVGVCCLARKLGVKAEIVIDRRTSVAGELIDYLKGTEQYKSAFITRQDAILHADAHTLLVVVDTNRPEQVEDADILDACNKTAVIDHHRVGATYIKDAAMSFVEPYASSASELLAEILQELTERDDILKCEADALLSGIVLDTKNFTIRTGDRTFDAAAYLRRCGADTTDVKKLMQNDMNTTLSKFHILQEVELYHGIAVAAPEEPTQRVVAAKAADELLNISGVDASIIIYESTQGGRFVSARSIGEVNVQIIMEKIGGGGNRSAAAAQLESVTRDEALEKIHAAIDEYFENK